METGVQAEGCGKAISNALDTSGKQRPILETGQRREVRTGLGNLAEGFPECGRVFRRTEGAGAEPYT